MSSFAYDDELHDGEIRLIELLPGGSEAHVQCRLLKGSFDKLPPYEALSYVWGDPGLTDTITCNGQVMRVTVSLTQALQQLRPRQGEDSSRILWADAICINQENVAERNRQVQLMTHIYMGAARVVAWLGPDDTEALAPAIAAVDHVYSLYTRSVDEQERLSVVNEPVDYVYSLYAQTVGEETRSYAVNRAVDDFSLAELDQYIQGQNLSCLYKSLKVFCALSYWTRMWCVQEVNLAQRLTFMTGERDIAREAISVFTQWYCGAIQKGFAGEEEKFESRMYPEGLFEVDRMVTFWTLGEYQDLFMLLEIFRERRAADPRDKVYGLLGILRTDDWNTTSH